MDNRWPDNGTKNRSWKHQIQQGSSSGEHNCAPETPLAIRVLHCNILRGSRNFGAKGALKERTWDHQNEWRTSSEDHEYPQQIKAVELETNKLLDMLWLHKASAVPSCLKAKVLYVLTFVLNGHIRRQSKHHSCSNEDSGAHFMIISPQRHSWCCTRLL